MSNILGSANIVLFRFEPIQLKYRLALSIRCREMAWTMGSWGAIIKEEKIPVMSTSVVCKEARRNSTILFSSRCSGMKRTPTYLYPTLQEIVYRMRGQIAPLMGHHISKLLPSSAASLDACFPSSKGIVVVSNKVWGAKVS